VETIDPERSLPFTTGTRESQDRILRAITREAELVTEMSLHEESGAGAHDTDAFDRAFVPLIHRFLLTWVEPLTAEDIEASRDRHREDLIGPERVWAKQIFVEINEWTDAEAARRQAEALLQRLETEEFYAVARDHYATVGLEYDGRIGTIRRGDIPPERFALFWEAPVLERPFGPIESPEGFLILQVDERLPEGLAPAEALEERRRKVERLRLPEDEILTPDAVLYRLDGREVTVREVIERLPHIHGDARDPRYFAAMREHAIRADLIETGPAADWVRASPHCHFLAQAHRNAWLIQQHLDTLFAQIDTSDEAIERFWREDPQGRFHHPDELALTVVRVPHGPLPQDDLVAQRLAMRPTYARARRLRESWLRDPSPEALASVASPEFWEIESAGEPVPLDRLGRVLGVAAQSLAQGETSELVIMPEGYLFCHVERRILGAPLRFEEIEEQVRFRSAFSQRLTIREQLLGMSLGLEGWVP
jgi:hypothetical protein